MLLKNKIRISISPKLKISLLIFLGIAMFVIAHYLIYREHVQIGNKDKTPLFIFPAFFLICGGLSCFSKIYHMAYIAIDKKIGSPKRLLKYTYNFTKIVLVCIAALPYFYYTTKYDKNQLANFGVIQKVTIEKTFTRSSLRGGSSEMASFHININDTVIYRELPKRVFSVGDIGTVIFSSQNPNVIKWFNEYTK